MEPTKIYCFSKTFHLLLGSIRASRFLCCRHNFIEISQAHPWHLILRFEKLEKTPRFLSQTCFRVSIKTSHPPFKSRLRIYYNCIMWCLEKLLISTCKSLTHKRAIPPLLPSLGIIRPFGKPILSFTFTILLAPTFVSIKKTMLELYCCTRLCSTRTVREFPIP